jgi:hypothetical protein
MASLSCEVTVYYVMALAMSAYLKYDTALVALNT